MWLTTTIPANILGILSNYVLKRQYLCRQDHTDSIPGPGRRGDGGIVGVTVYPKTGLKDLNSFTCAHAHLRGQDRTPLWSPQVLVFNHHYIC